MFRTREWIAPAVATVAFLVALAAFVVVLSRYRDSVMEWSRAELQSRAELTAVALAEPLRTLDFKAINATADRLKAEGLRLRIVSGREFYVSGDGPRQGFYDTSGEQGQATAPSMWGVAHTGDFHIGVGRPSSQVLKPFLHALAVVVFAGLVGVLALGVVFFVLYRQRVRISELAKLEKFRRDFVADVSHEIRTPLTGILGAVDMLRGGGAEKAETRNQLLEMVEKESRRLAALVQQILDLARLEREGDVLNRVETDIADLAREVAEKYGVALRIGPGAEDAKGVFCDAQLVSQALSNLVENAIRHSGSKDIAVICSVDAKRVHLAVEDHGVGVPPEQVGRIFERFHRVDPARAAETGGAGLGLAIVRRIMRLHGGDAAYSPARPRGSVFELSFPPA